MALKETAMKKPVHASSSPDAAEAELVSAAQAHPSAFALLYFVVGIQGSRGARFDFMAVFWRSVLALGCLGLLIFIGGFRL